MTFTFECLKQYFQIVVYRPLYTGLLKMQLLGLFPRLNESKILGIVFWLC